MVNECGECGKEITESEGSINKYGYSFHKEICWRKFCHRLRKARKGGVVGSRPEI